MTQMKFAFSEKKALEALAYIAHTHEGFSPLYVAKILFYAEKWHINRYGRPIIADTYIAMPRGPVPSVIKDFIDQNWNWVEKPEGFDDAVNITVFQGMRRLMKGKRPPNLDLLSESDIECLKEAIEFCLGKSADELSNLTHLEKSYLHADPNKPMNYLFFIDEDNPNKEVITEVARENAIHGVV